MQVSCFGAESESDTGDFWRWVPEWFLWTYLTEFSLWLMIHIGGIFHRLTIEGSGKIWKQDQRIRLQHVDTGGYLHSHDKKYSRIAGGQQEVRTGNCVLLLFWAINSNQNYFVSLKDLLFPLLLRVHIPIYNSRTMLFNWILSIDNPCACTGLWCPRKACWQCLVSSRRRIPSSCRKQVVEL